MPDPTRREAARAARVLIARDAIGGALAKWHPDIMAGAVKDAAREVVTALDAYEQAMAGEPGDGTAAVRLEHLLHELEGLLSLSLSSSSASPEVEVLATLRKRLAAPLTRADVERVVPVVLEVYHAAEGDEEYTNDMFHAEVWSRLTEGRA